MKTFTATRRVAWRDTDAAGIVHFSVFFTYMESVEHEFLRSLGSSVLVASEQGAISWPRVAAHCDYRSPAYFEDQLEVALWLGRVGNSSATYRYLFSREREKIASGEVTAVCCRVEHGRPPQSIRIPDDLRHGFDAYLCPER